MSTGAGPILLSQLIGGWSILHSLRYALHSLLSLQPYLVCLGRPMLFCETSMLVTLVTTTGQVDLSKAEDCLVWGGTVQACPPQQCWKRSVKDLCEVGNGTCKTAGAL